MRERMNIIHLMCIEYLRLFRRAQDTRRRNMLLCNIAIARHALALRPIFQLLLRRNDLSRELIRTNHLIINVSAATRLPHWVESIVREEHAHNQTAGASSSRATFRNMFSRSMRALCRRRAL
jgi:hypothetical protein